MITGKTVVIAVKKLSNQFSRLLIEAEQQFTDKSERLTGMQRTIVGFLLERHEKEDVFQKNIEEEFNIRRSTATGILQLMEKKGIIRREPDPNDARWKKIVLTAKTLEFAEKFSGHMKKYSSRILKDISQEELEKFLDVAERIRKNLK